MHEFRIKRVYDEPSADDGTRFLIDRLWPRGVNKRALAAVEWVKMVAPSPTLRKWFGHEAAKWQEFRKCYRAELENNATAWEPLVQAAKRHNVTLLYGARDRQINHAVVLKEFLENKSKQK